MFATIIEANYISKREDLFASFRLTEDDEREIRQMAKDERIGEKVEKFPTIISSAVTTYYDDRLLVLLLALLFALTSAIIII